ncbi:MAG: helix-turn-helix domain-containing protein [Steroidobacteraceae bacterium]
MNKPAAPPGARLKAEREHRGLSAQKAADEMHLDRWVIDALEADDYKRIGPTVYAKGHLKKYAALLGLPAAEIVAGYESRTQAPGEAAAAGPGLMLAPRANAPDTSNMKPMQIAVGTAAVLMLLGVLWWRPWHQRAAPRHAPPAAAVTTVPDKAADADEVSRAAASPAVVGESAPAPGAAQGAPASAAAAPAQPAAAIAQPAAPAAPLDAAALPGAGYARLRLSFSADSWVDVRDASGRRTYSGTGLANSVKTIAGTAPMRVYLGFGSGVQLEINDRVVAIGPQFFSGDVARFEAGADGVLRRDSRGDPSRGDPSRGDPSRGDPSHGVPVPSSRPSG